MDRRALLGSVGSALLVLIVPARAQKSNIPVIGFLSTGDSPGPRPAPPAGFVRGLNETGYFEGKNLAIEYRFAEGQYDRLPAMAIDLVNRHVALLATFGGGASARAAKAATSTIPIVFMGVSDPVTEGLGKSVGRPGENATGVGIFAEEVTAKRFQIMHEFVPRTSVVAILVNPGNDGAAAEEREAKAATQSLGQELHVFKARNEIEIEEAFATLVRLRCQALVVASDTTFYRQRRQIIRLAARYAMPASYESRGIVADGGLMSYGPNLFEIYRQAGVYAGKVLGGTKPGDLPVLFPTKLELVINLKTAKALGLTIPQSILLRADEVIQ